MFIVPLVENRQSLKRNFNFNEPTFSQFPLESRLELDALSLSWPCHCHSRIIKQRLHFKARTRLYLNLICIGLQSFPPYGPLPLRFNLSSPSQTPTQDSLSSHFFLFLRRSPKIFSSPASTFSHIETEEMPRGSDLRLYFTYCLQESMKNEQAA